MAIVGLASILQVFGAYGVTGDELEDALWPGIVVGALAICLLILLDGLIAEQRRASAGEPLNDGPSDEDQQQFDTLLGIVSSSATLLPDRHFGWA